MYVARPLSRKDIQKFADKIRNEYDVTGYWFPVMEIFETLYISWVILENDELPENEPARLVINNENRAHIEIRESTYLKAHAGLGKERATVLHELCHWWLFRKFGITFSETKSKSVVAFQDPEWQAKALVGELMMPRELIKDLSVEEVMDKCGVSRDAAEYQLRFVKKKNT